MTTFSDGLVVSWFLFAPANDNKNVKPPILPTNIKNMRMYFDAVARLAVIPIELPTVAIAEATSKNTDLVLTPGVL